MHPTPVARLFDEQPHHPEAGRSPTLAARYYIDPEIFEAGKEAMDFVGPEDIRLCEAVPRGLRQRGYNQGRYVIDAARNEWSEHALHHFHRQYPEHMAARSDNP